MCMYIVNAGNCFILKACIQHTAAEEGVRKRKGERVRVISATEDYKRVIHMDMYIYIYKNGIIKLILCMYTSKWVCTDKHKEMSSIASKNVIMC